MNDVILVDHPHEGVAVMTLNRPERMNALNADMIEKLGAVLSKLDADPGVKVVVITGAGRAFCAGHDLGDVQDNRLLPVGERMRLIDEEIRSILTVRTSHTPTIAAVNGAARGGGMALAVACDMRIAAETATFGVAFINIGISSGDCGLSWTLPKLVGYGVASELMLTGRIVDAPEAGGLGLVNRVVPDDRLLLTAIELAATIAQHDGLAIRMTKRALNYAGNTSLADAVTLETTAQVLAMDSDAAKRKNDEFLERRPRL